MVNVNQDVSEVFRKGCLVNLRTSIWGGRVRIPKDRIKIDADDEWWNAVKHLVSKDALKPIEKVRNEMRVYLYNKSLPFPLHNVVFVVRDLIDEIDAKMKEMQINFEAAAGEFVSHYAEFIAQAVPRLGSLFNPADYPRNIEQKFSFSWNFYTIGIDNGQIGVISPEILNREKRKIEQMMTQFAQDAVAVLRARFLDMLTHITERLCGYEKHVFRDSLIEGPRKFMEDFHKLNICDDHELAEMIAKTQTILGGVQVESLRNDIMFRNNIGQQVKKVEDTLISMMDVMGEGRDIELPDFDPED